MSAADVATALTPDLGEKMDVDDIRPGVLEPTAVDDASKPGGYVQILDVTGHAIATSGTKLPIDRGQVRRVLDRRRGRSAGSARDERLRMLEPPGHCGQRRDRRRDPGGAVGAVPGLRARRGPRR